MNTSSVNDETSQARVEGDTEMRILSVGVQVPKLNVLPMKESLMMRLKGFFSREKKQAALPRPVQAEFPMDRIVVVRNDLSDSDYELVWSEAPAQAAKGDPKPKGEQLVGRAWKKVNPFAKKKEAVKGQPKEESVEV